MTTASFLVYGLIDPRTHELRYVGKSTQGVARPRMHRTPSARKKQTHLGAWLRLLHSLGLEPEIWVIEEASSAADADLLERETIGYYRFVGADLVNHTRGGDGVQGFRHSAATRSKLAVQHQGKKRGPHTEEHKNNLSNSHLKRRDQTAASMRQYRSQHPMTDVERQKHQERVAARQGTPVVDQNGTVYPSQGAAARKLGVRQNTIHAVLMGRQKAVSGYVFRYLNPKGPVRTKPWKSWTRRNKQDKK